MAGASQPQVPVAASWSLACPRRAKTSITELENAESICLKRNVYICRTLLPHNCNSLNSTALQLVPVGRAATLPPQQGLKIVRRVEEELQVAG